MGLKIRFGGIALLIFLALFFDPMDGVFKWDVISGVCEEVYDYEGNASDDSFTPIDDVQGAFSCGDGSISITVPKIAILLDIQTLLFNWGITFLWSTLGKWNESRSMRRLPTLPRLLVS